MNYELYIDEKHYTIYERKLLEYGDIDVENQWKNTLFFIYVTLISKYMAITNFKGWKFFLILRLFSYEGHFVCFRNCFQFFSIILNCFYLLYIFKNIIKFLILYHSITIVIKIINYFFYLNSNIIFYILTA